MCLVIDFFRNVVIIFIFGLCQFLPMSAIKISCRLYIGADMSMEKA